MERQLSHSEGKASGQEAVGSLKLVCLVLYVHQEPQLCKVAS